MASKLIVNNLESLTNGRDITVDSIVTEQQLGLLEADLLDRVMRYSSIASLVSAPASSLFDGRVYVLESYEDGYKQGGGE